MGEPLITWRGLVLGADGSDIDVEKISGWDDLPETTDYSVARVRGHGDHPGDLYSQARIVTVSGSIASRAGRDQLAAAIRAASPLDSTVRDLTITTFGTALTAGARLTRRTLPVEADYASGAVPFTLQWRCPDPLRYGPPQPAQSTGLPTSGGGLAWPLFSAGVLDWGTPGSAGQITLINGGTADAPIQLQVIGPVPGGFEISAGGQRLTYPVAVPAGQTIWIDTGAGTVLAEGTADRRSNLTHADWLLVPARDPETGIAGLLTLQFTGLGAYDPSARLVVPGFQEVHW